MGESRNDLRIAGAGSVSGGTYGAVTVSGTGTVKGDLDCTELKVGGTADIDGNLKAGSVNIGGAMTIKGNVEADLLKVGGSASIHGDASVKTLSTGGSTDVQGNLKGEKIDVKGGIRVAGDCSAEYFSVKGGFAIDGLLNAGQVDINLHGHSRAREIGGEEIRVRKGFGSKFGDLLQRFFYHPVELVTDSIEGDEVHLESTRAKAVRGNNVTVGAGCEIDLVEYRGQFRLLEGAKVKENRKV